MNLEPASRLPIIFVSRSRPPPTRIRNYSWIEIRSSSKPLKPLVFRKVHRSRVNGRSSRTSPLAPSRAWSWQGIEGRGRRQLGWFYDERNAHPLAGPRPSVPLATRDVNFTVFMNIYINLHFTAASAATQRRRDGLEKKKEKKKERSACTTTSKARVLSPRRRRRRGWKTWIIIYVSS